MDIRSLRLIVLSAAAGAFLSASAAPEDVGYAPPGTNLIVRINGPRICSRPVFDTVRKDSRFIKVEKDSRSDLAKHGLVIDDLLNTDIFIFADGKAYDPRRPRFTLVARGVKPLAETVLTWLDLQIEPSDWLSVAKTPVGGKNARVFRDEDNLWTAIALEKDLFQLSLNVPSAALTPRPPVAFAAVMAPEAMLSLSCKMDEVADAELGKRLPPELAPFVPGLESATVNILDGEDRVRIKAELIYPAPERAKAVRSQLNGLLLALMFSQAEKHPEKVAVLRKIRVSGKGPRVKISCSCRYDELDTLIGLFL